MAHVTIHGNLAADPKIYDTSAGKVAQLRVIENPRWRSEDGTWHTGEPEAHNVVLWGADAEHSSNLRTGDTVLIEGSTYVETWTDDQGQERKTTKVRARHIGISLRYVTALIDRSGEPMGRRTPVRTRHQIEPDVDQTPDQDHSS